MSDEMIDFIEQISDKKVKEIEKETEKKKKKKKYKKDDMKPKIPQNEKDIEGLDYITE